MIERADGAWATVGKAELLYRSHHEATIFAHDYTEYAEGMLL